MEALIHTAVPFWESETVASAFAFLVMAIGGAITLYASSHWSVPKREARKAKRDPQPEEE